MSATGWPALTPAEWDAVEDDQRSGRHYPEPDRCWDGLVHAVSDMYVLVAPPWSAGRGTEAAR